MSFSDFSISDEFGLANHLGQHESCRVKKLLITSYMSKKSCDDGREGKAALTIK